LLKNFRIKNNQFPGNGTPLQKPPENTPKNGTEPLDHYPTNGRFGTEHFKHRFFGVKNGTVPTVTA